MPTPDRPTFALVPATRNALTARQEKGLSEQQRRQLSRITIRYLKDHGVPDSFVNISNAVPVVHECIESGLLRAANRRNLEPTDNIQKAYEIGKDERDAFLHRVDAELPSLSLLHESYIGSLALPEAAVSAARAEADRRIFEPRFNRGRVLLTEIDNRRPILDKVVQFARQEVERIIPSAKDVKLTPEQETGLARNLIFTYIATDSTFPVLETGYIVKNQQAFLQNSADIKQAGQRLYELLYLNAQVSDSETRTINAFLADTLAQMTQRILSLPAGLVVSLENINNLYKHLSPYFILGENPLLRLAVFSEDPKDRGRSLWDPVRSAVVEIKDKRYQVVQPDVLRISALRSKVAGNSQKAAEYEKAADATSHFLTEAQSTYYLDEVAKAQKQAQKAQKDIDGVGLWVRSGKFPPKVVLTPGAIRRYASAQLETMADEKKFFHFLREQIDTRKQTALRLLEKYWQGSIAQSEDRENLEDLYFSPRKILNRARYFCRDRVVRRIQLFESVYTPTAEDGEVRDLEPFFSQALDSTVIDFLLLRSAQRTKVFLDMSELLGGENYRTVWQALIDFETNRIEEQIYLKALTYVSIQATLEGTKDSLEEKAAKVIEERKDSLLGGVTSPLRIRQERVRFWKRTLGQGGKPRIESIPPQMLNAFTGNKENEISSAIGYWDPNIRLCEALTKKLDQIGETPPSKVAMTNQMSRRRFERMLASTFGPAQILLHALASFVPSELFTVSNRSLEDTVHQYRSAYLDYKFGDKAAKESVRVRIIASREEFRQVLADRGLRWDYTTFVQIAPFSTHFNLVTAREVIGSIFGLEQKINAWFDQQEARLAYQQKQNHQILAVYPNVFIKQAKFAFASATQHADRLQRDWSNTVESRVKQLQALRAIRILENSPDSATHS